MIDARIPLMVQGIDGTKMLENGSKIADHWISNQTEGELSRLYKESNGNLDQMLQLGQQSKMARWVMPQLQAQKTAQENALLERQKAQADIFATQSKGTKDFADAGNTNQKTGASRYGLGQDVWTAVTRSGDPNAGRLLLNRHLTSGAIDQATYDGLNGQLTALDGQKPSAVQDFAFNQAKSQLDPKYNFATIDAQEANATSERNSQRTYDASVHSTDVGAQTADKNRAQSEKQFQQNFEYTAQQDEIKNGQAEVKEYGGKAYIVYKNGQFKPAIGADGQPLGAGNLKGMTEQQSKDALFGARMQESNTILNELDTKNKKNTFVGSVPVINNVPWVGESLAAGLPALLGGANEDQGKYMQARRDFISAVLRKESGAAIADSEFANAEKQYFPQKGDSDAIIAQKARNRELATKMILAGSGQTGQQLVNKVTGKEENSTSPSFNSYSYSP